MLTCLFVVIEAITAVLEPGPQQRPPLQAREYSED